VAAVDRSTDINSSEGLTFRQLLDHLPRLCTELANVLKDPAADSPRVEASRQSGAHARTRWQQGYRLDEVIREFCIIRRDFLGRWLDAFEQEHGEVERETKRRTKRIIHRFFDDAMIDSTVQFVEEQQQAAAEREAALLQQTARADAAADAKSAFLALISHELRTPLTPVLLEASGRLADRTLTPEVRESMATIRHNVEVEAALVDDLLDAARLTAGSLDLVKTDVDVQTCLREAAVACRRDFELHNVELSLNLPPSKAVIPGDGARLQRAFVSLLRNAANVSRAGGKVLAVSRYAEGERELQISVQDNGETPDAETIARMLEPFEQGRRQLSAPGAFGVSRYVAKAIVEAHGGTVWIEAAAGGGAIYYVRLPLAAH
jgi:signal transduction histidine kinase